VVSLDYLDTSALMRWVENDVATPTPRDEYGAALVDALLGESSAIVAVCGLTLVEVRSAISRDWRIPDAAHDLFDGSWAARANLGVMTLVAEGRLRIIKPPPRAEEHAVTLVHLATDEHGIALGTWDAIHLITAARWAYDEGDRVRLHTCDDGFGRFVGHYSEFERFVEIVDLNPPAE
jgi:hypothetical protein